MCTSGALEQIEFVVKNTEMQFKKAIKKASALVRKIRDEFVCGADNRKNVVGFLGAYTSGNSKLISDFLQVPSVDIAMIAPTSTVRRSER